MRTFLYSQYPEVTECKVSTSDVNYKRLADFLPLFSGQMFPHAKVLEERRAICRCGAFSAGCSEPIAQPHLYAQGIAGGANALQGGPVAQALTPLPLQGQLYFGT